MKSLLAVTLVAALASAFPSNAAAAADATQPGLVRQDGVAIVRQSDPQAALVGVEVVIPAGLDRQTLRQNGLAALVAQTILATPVTVAGAPAVPLERAIAASGGSIRFAIDPDNVHFYVEALAQDGPAVIAMFRQALAAPDFTPATVVMPTYIARSASLTVAAVTVPTTPPSPSFPKK